MAVRYFSYQCYLLGRECFPSAKAYNKSNRWKWHEDLAWDLVLEGYYELKPNRATGSSPGSLRPGEGLTTAPQPVMQNGGKRNGQFVPGVCLPGNTTQSQQGGYISKHYQLPACRKQLGSHEVERISRPKPCVFCRFLPSPHISPDFRSQISNLNHPQAPQHFKIR